MAPGNLDYEDPAQRSRAGRPLGKSDLHRRIDPATAAAAVIRAVALAIGLMMIGTAVNAGEV